MNPSAEMSAQLSANITLLRAAAFVEWLVDLWRDKGCEIRRPDPGQVQLVLAEVGLVTFHVVSARQLNCTVQTVTSQMGEAMQLSLTDHLGEFADEMAWPDGSWSLVWNGQAPQSPVRLYVLEVLGNQALTPRMRRVRLSCEDLRPFTDGGLHVRMLLPAQGQEPVWPTLLGDGRLKWPSGSPRMPRRTYTIREINLEASWIDIDVLIHAESEDISPGSTWAECAQPGSKVGVLSPASGLLPPAAHYVLVADACALPAAARMAQMLSQERPPAMLLWVAHDAERAAFDLPATAATVICPNWICSGEPGASAPEIAQVMEWLAQQDWQRADTAMWVAGGLPLTQAVRRWAADQPQLAGVRTMIHTYWR